MKIHAQEILKRNIQFVLFVGLSVVSTATIVSNIQALRKLDHPLLIAIDGNGTRLVSEPTDPIFKTEAVNFINRFLFNTYNFDSSNFMKRIGAATILMSENLWSLKKTEILSLKEKVDRDQISVSGQIARLTIDETGTYHALVDLREKSRLNEQSHQIQIALKVIRVPRSPENTYGMEVDSYEENLLRN
jgi:hypothetical protein